MTCRDPAGIKIKEQAKVEQIQKQIDKKDNQLEDKGKALVYGAKYTLEQETNKTPTIVVSSRFLDLATLSLGNPSANDARIIKEISDNLLAESKIQLALTKEEADKYKKLHLDGELKFKKLENEIILIQKEKQLKINELELKNEKLEEVNAENAGKAAEYDKEHGFWQQFNIFSDIFSLIKKLFVLSIILGVGFIVFKVLEILFPALNILGVVFGGLGKIVMKFVPGITKTMGLVSSKVYGGFKGLVKATEDALRKIEEVDIESKLIINYPEDYKFTKLEVKNLLEQHSEAIENIIKEELKEHSNDEDRALVTKAKIDLGIKSEAKNIEI